eukprot:scaffold999_cov375-Prasinococcus_capsulatus_cf.AAC.3
MVANDACYLYRDLAKGSYGGDVYCLQEFLRKNVRPHATLGYMTEKPSAFYGEKTTEAVVAYQARHGINEPRKGVVGRATRRLFARKNGAMPLPSERPSPPPVAVGRAGLPTPEEIETENKELKGANGRKLCMDACAMFNEEKYCHTRCVRQEKNKVHACREACQIAFAEACDRQHPGEARAAQYQECLAHSASQCTKLCAQHD